MMAPAGNETTASPLSPTLSTKRYNRIKLGLAVVSSVVSFMFLILLMCTGSARSLAQWANQVTAHPTFAWMIFAGTIAAAQMLLTLPIGYYSGYLLEHRFHLSNQTLGAWAWERCKGLLISVPIGLLILLVLYACMTTWGDFWWFPVALILSLFSLVVARLAPTLILPLFYKLTPIEEGPVKDAILAQCTSADLYVNGIFQFDLSKNTRKANAGFTGIGKARRIILGDTLVREFTPDEIETVFAHELGHYKHRHITVGILVGVATTFLGLFVASVLHRWSLAAFDIAVITDLAGLPLLAIWLAVFGLVTSPLGNVLSRHHERQADRFAVNTTGKPDAFAGALRKLAAMNLADSEPHPLVEFLFYSHPSIGKRVRLVESMAAR